MEAEETGSVAGPTATYFDMGCHEACFAESLFAA